jgi:sugar-specific transcriptional regulator TrmB
MDLKLLEKAGLSERESKAYIALLNLGTSKIGAIQKESKVPSSKMAETLNKLKKKDLIEIVLVNHNKNYRAKDPSLILEDYKKDEKEIEKTINELKLLKTSRKEEEYVELYQGFVAIRKLFKFLLQDAKEGEEYFGFSSGETTDIKEVWDLYTFIGRIREEKGVKNMQLAKETVKNKYQKSYIKVIVEHKETKKTKSYSYKEMVKYTNMQLPGDGVIFRNNLVLLNLNSEIPSAILITGKIIVDNYKRFFMDLWNNLK